MRMDNYAFLMIKYKTPSLIKDIHNKLDPNDIYKDDTDNKHSYGIEKDTHVTVVPCMDNDVNIDDIKKLLEPLDKYKIYLTNISKFDNDKYDVLKCDVASMALFKTNADILKKFKSHSEYKEYNPHVTIAYTKKGIADNFTKDTLDKLVMLEPECFWFSYYDSDGNEKELTWK